MKARVLDLAFLFGAFVSTLPAADPQLMKLVMPDVKVLVYINVMQAKLSPAGQYVLSQMEGVAWQAGFDPRQDLIELFVVWNGAPKTANPLALASGVFDPARIAAAAAASGATHETYKGVTIIHTNPAKTEGRAFLTGSIMIGGSIANLKAAIDRQSAPPSLPPSLVTLVNQSSATQDALLFTENLATSAPSDAPQVLGFGLAAPANLLQMTKSGYIGLKFGSNVAFTAQFWTDTPENAAALAGFLQLAVNIAQAQTAQNPDIAALAKSLVATARGSTVNISGIVPGSQFQQLLTPEAAVKGERK